MSTKQKRKVQVAALPLRIPPVLDPQQRYSLPEAALILRIAMTTLYRRMQEGRISTVQDGGRTFIHGKELVRYSAQPAGKEAA
jgi:hypothetical protein